MTPGRPPGPAVRLIPPDSLMAPLPDDAFAAAVAASACTACHRFNNEGLGIGPDISGAGNRYNVKDLLENIIEPSRVISFSDSCRFTRFLRLISGASSQTTTTIDHTLREIAKIQEFHS